MIIYRSWYLKFFCHVTEYLCQKWPCICYVCCNHNPFISSSMIYHQILDKKAKTGDTSISGTAYPSEVPEFTLGFWWDSCCDCQLIACRLHILVPCCDIQNQFRLKSMFGSSLLAFLVRVWCFIYIIDIYLGILASNAIPMHMMFA